ncbi:MAG TPA: hypothetical protein VFT65_17035 [Candidatus Angelobacter sp.]|nr:hypothetical protein [Candidatus Angelobacter sp.]
MDQENRVLSRKGARELNEQEVEIVSGGLRTLTACTIAVTGADGDVFLHEC